MLGVRPKISPLYFYRLDSTEIFALTPSKGDDGSNFKDYLTLAVAVSELPRLSSQEMVIASPLRPGIWNDRNGFREIDFPQKASMTMRLLRLTMTSFMK